MAAPYVKRYPGGFLDLPNQTTPVDSAFLNAVETALLHLLGEAPANDEVGVWTGGAGGGLVYQKITNAQIAAGAAIDKSKLAALNITDADIAAAAGIAKSKLGPLNIADADIVAGAAIAIAKLSGYPGDVKKHLRGDGSWATARACILRHSVNQSQGNNGGGTGGYQAITWDTEVYDPDGMHGANPTRITVADGGIYGYAANVDWAANATNFRSMGVFKNGINIAQAQTIVQNPGASTDISQHTAGICDLVPGDYLEVGVYQNSGAAVNILAGSPYTPKFHVWRIA